MGDGLVQSSAQETEEAGLTGTGQSAEFCFFPFVAKVTEDQSRSGRRDISQKKTCGALA